MNIISFVPTMWICAWRPSLVSVNMQNRKLSCAVACSALKFSVRFPVLQSFAGLQAYIFFEKVLSAQSFNLQLMGKGYIRLLFRYVGSSSLSQPQSAKMYVSASRKYHEQESLTSRHVNSTRMFINRAVIVGILT